MVSSTMKPTQSATWYGSRLGKAEIRFSTLAAIETATVIT